MRTRSSLFLTALCLGGLSMVGCGPADSISMPYELPAAPAPGGGLVVASVVPLSPETPRPTGVWIAPDTGRLGVVDGDRGLYERVGEEWSELASASELLDGTGAWGEFTDVAALPGDRFAVTVPSDGLLFDGASRTTAQHFCYEPGDTGDWVTQSQVTQSLTYDAATDQLFANPQTFEGGAVLSSELGVFHAESGTPLQWYGLPDRSIVASGLVVQEPGVFVLAIGDSLFAYNVNDGELEPIVDLSGLGVITLAGLAIHPHTDALWAVDAGQHELVEITGWR